MTATVSIITPNYNNSQYLRDCLDSVRAQTFHDWECIIVDDASTDNSVDIIKEYCRDDKRFRLMRHKTNRGAAAARNTALTAARGEYVMFLDPDDAYPQTAIETLYSTAVMNNVEMVRGGVSYVPDNWRFVQFNLYNNAVVNVYHVLNSNFNNFVYDTNIGINQGGLKAGWIWNKIFKRSAIKNHWFPDNTWPVEDVCWFLELVPKLKNFAAVSTPVCFHRMSKTGITRQGFGRDFSYLARQLDYYVQNIGHMYPKSFEKVYFGGIIEIAYNEVVLPVLQSRDKSILNRKIQELRSLYNHQVRPTRYLSLRKRLVFWWFMSLEKLTK